MFAIGLSLVAAGLAADFVLENWYHRMSYDWRRKVAACSVITGATLMLASLVQVTWKYLP